MSTIDQDLMHIERQANDAMSVAAMRGYDLPDEYQAARAIEAEANKTLNTQAPAADYPTKPAAVAKWVATTAQDRAAWREARAVAAELAEQANRNALRSAVQAVPRYVALVARDFEQHLADFRRLLPVAPRDVTGYTSPEQFVLHAEQLRATENLSAAAVDRGRLALLTDDAEIIGADGLWLILNPTGDASIAAVTAALHTFHGRLPVTVAEWVDVLALGVEMTTAEGQVAARRERFNRAMKASVNAADRGMHDRTIDDALPGAR